MGFLIKKASNLILQEIVTTLNNSEIIALNITPIAIDTIKANVKIVNIQLTVNDQVTGYGNLNIINTNQEVIASFNSSSFDINIGYTYFFSLSVDIGANELGYRLQQPTDQLFIKAKFTPITAATLMTVKLYYFD
jgi:hypothetical protein